MDYDTFGIVWYFNEDGVREYGCQGTGPKYDKFYSQWIGTSSYRCVREDFPWDIFMFDDPKDHYRLINDFPMDVSEDVFGDLDDDNK